MNKDFRPKLRWPLDIQRHQVGGEEVLVFVCPHGFSEPLGLKAATGPLLHLCDGSHTAEEIVNRFAAHGVTLPLVLELIAMLENHGFLETPSFYQRKREVEQSFLARSSRPAALAGAGYPNKREDLVFEVDRYLACAKPTKKKESHGDLLALISPHIDYRRGGACYGEAYSHLVAKPHDIYLLLGTAHQYCKSLFLLSKKNFETPLGVLKTDTDFVTTLSERYGVKRSFQDEFLHKNEHSLELQTPFLKHVAPHAEIVPILVGSFYGYLQREIYPKDDAQYDEFVSIFVDLFRAALKAGKRVCLLAGVDMAHVGKHFGDEKVLTPEALKGIEARDREYLQAITSGSSKRLFDHIAEDADARRVCGFPTMYTVLDLLERMDIRFESVLYDYQQAYDPKSDCGVTFAAMGLYREGLKK